MADKQPRLFGAPDAYGDTGPHAPLPDVYPETPAPGKHETSAAAAEAIKRDVNLLRVQILDLLREKGPMTVHECAEVLDKKVWTIQPRFSELATTARGAIPKIVDSGTRRKNSVTGRTAIVWQLAKAPEADRQP